MPVVVKTKATNNLKVYHHENMRNVITNKTMKDPWN